MKTADHFWTDPPADELVQRHRIHSSGKHAFVNPGSPKRPGLQVNCPLLMLVGLVILLFSLLAFVTQIYSDTASGRNNARVIHNTDECRPGNGYRMV